MITDIAGVDIDMLVNGKLIGCAQTMKLDEKVDTASAVCRADSTTGAAPWKRSVAGALSWSSSLDGLMRHTDGGDIAANLTYKELTDLKDARALVTVSFGIATAGASRRVGTAHITGISQDAKDTGFGTFSVSLEGSGPLTWVANPA